MFHGNVLRQSSKYHRRTKKSRKMIVSIEIDVISDSYSCSEWYHLSAAVYTNNFFGGGQIYNFNPGSVSLSLCLIDSQSLAVFFLCFLTLLCCKIFCFDLIEKFSIERIHRKNKRFFS